jgi:hypothetical protein
VKVARIAQPVPHEQNERLIVAGVDVDVDEAVA